MAGVDSQNTRIGVGSHRSHPHERQRYESSDSTVSPTRDRLRSLSTYPLRLGSTVVEPRRFGGLALVNSLSAAGDAVATVALAGSIFVSVPLHAARGRTALGLVCTVLPFVLVGPFLGPLIGRIRGGRRAVIVAASVGRSITSLMMAAWIHSLALFGAAFLFLVFSKVHSIARASIVPVLVADPAQLVAANSRLAVGSSLSSLTAGGSAAVLYGLAGPEMALGFACAVYVAVAVLSALLLPGKDEIRGRPGARPHWSWLTSRRLPPSSIVRAWIPTAGLRAMVGFMVALVVFSFRAQGAPIIWYGLAGIAGIAGNLGGSLLAPKLRTRTAERALIAVSSATAAVMALLATQLPGLDRRPATLVLAATVGLASSVAKTAFDSIVQQQVPEAEQATTFAHSEALLQVGWVLFALVPTLIPVPLAAGFVAVALVAFGTATALLVRR